MRFSLQREVFLKPLAQVVNVVERRQTLPVLANLLVHVKDGQLSLTGVCRPRGELRESRRPLGVIGRGAGPVRGSRLPVS